LGQINAVGVVFGKELNIGGQKYNVRLLKGRGDGLDTLFGANFTPTQTLNSEWTILIYNVCSVTSGPWAQFSEIDLVTNRASGNGCQTWLQDTVGSFKLLFGDIAINYATRFGSDYISTRTSWRPCLELIND
jgi:hypothetical protein